MSSAVIAYDRPLAPGTVRITGSSAGIAIRIAPQGSRRVFLAVLIPAIVAAASLALAAFGLLSGGAGDTGLPILIVLGVSAGYLVYRMVLRSANPIEIFADPKL